MSMINKQVLFILISITLTSCFSTRPTTTQNAPLTQRIVASPLPARSSQLRVGAERTRHYFSSLRHGRKVAVVANQTSLIGTTHLVDSLLNAGIFVVKVFTPEHGFRGSAEAGAAINNEIDAKTGLPIISLYGKNKKPTTEDLQDIDIVVFDLQDVGVRFYTYISTLSLVMEACAEVGIPVLVLDRPNPNGFYVDGPILLKEHQSFVGMHPVPIVHGMTMAEYARMVNNERWLTGEIKCRLRWVACSGYNHKSFYNLPVRPSPNLPDTNSVILYPTLCLFEGTKVSVGRGTDYPFSIIGYPGYNDTTFRFTPVSRPESLNPPYNGQLCFGKDMRDSVSVLKETPGLRLQWIIDMYQQDTLKTDFFNNFFINLAGTPQLRRQIEAGMNESEIRATWQTDLEEFLHKRSKYLIYRDF